MPDIASLVLAVDSSAVTKGTAALDGLAASGARAEAATVGLSGGFKGAGVEASAMAAAAQLSARAAVDQAAGFGAATNAARVNTMAMRESLVVAREISRGNFTRLPGSLTLLAQGIGSQGGIGAFASAMAQQLGLIRTVQNAELAEAATAAASAAAGVEAAARKAGANILAADTEVALAEAQLRVAEGATAEAAAQAQVAAANEAVTAAAAEAAIAENALATAQGRAAETGAASAAATRTLIGGSGIGLIGIATVGGLAYAAIKQFQNEVKDSGALDKYAESLNLTDAQVKKLGGSITYLKDGTREISDLTVTFGDVMAGVWEEVTRNSQGAFGNMKSAAGSAFDDILSFWNKTSAALSAGLWTIGDIAKDVFHYVAQIIGKGFVDGVNSAIDAINGLNKKIPTALGGGGDVLSHVDSGKPIVGNFLATARQQADANYAAALAINQGAYGRVESGAIAHRRGTIADIASGNRPKKPKKPKKPPKQAVDHADDTIARLDEQILQAKISLTKDATEEANLKVQELRVARDKTIADAQQLLSQHKITGAEFDIIKYKATELDNLKEKAVLDARDIKLMEEDQAAKDQLFGFQTDALKAADADASSQAEHRKLQLQMLDIAYQQKAADLQRLEETQKINGDLAAAAITQNSINHLPTQMAFDQAQILKSTQDPLHAWMDSIKTDGPAITEALQAIQVKGFDSLAQGIAGVVTGTESLGKAFKNISTQIIGDIIQMTVKMLLFRAISGIFGSIGGGGGGGFGGGVSGITDSFLGIPGTANGGSFIIGGNGGVDNNVLSLNGKPFDRISQGETLAVTPNRGGAANNNQNGPIELKISFGSAPDFAPYVEQVAGMAAGQAVKVSVDHTNNTIRQLRRPKISGGQ